MRRIAIALAGLVLVLAGLTFAGLRGEPAPEPTLPGTLAAGTLEHAGRTRSWRAYLPSQRRAAPPLVLVLHASMGDAAQARAMFGYDFDRLAEREGFIAVYPQGFERHWNDCRKAGPYSANRLDVDDVGFLRALVAHFVARDGADPARVFATGVSNGGQMALRLALEAPEAVRAVASVAASLPAAENLDCRPAGRPVSVLIMNGTADPMNPFAGGEVALYGVWGHRGAVLSSEDSADVFRELAGHTGPPTRTELADLAPDDGSTVEVLRWEQPGHPSVALYVVHGGGHNAPHPALRAPRLLGPTNHDIHAADEIWRFFARAP